MIFDDLDTARTGEDRQEDAIPMFAQEDPGRHVQVRYRQGPVEWTRSTTYNGRHATKMFQLLFATTKQ